MMPAADFIARLTGGRADPVAVAESYARGLKCLRDNAARAEKAARGRYRGLTAEEWNAKAEAYAAAGAATVAAVRGAA